MRVLWIGGSGLYVPSHASQGGYNGGGWVASVQKEIMKCENITLVDAIEFAEFDMSEGWILEMWPEWENPKITYWMPSPEPPKEE